MGKNTCVVFFAHPVLSMEFSPQKRLIIRIIFISFSFNWRVFSLHSSPTHIHFWLSNVTESLHCAAESTAVLIFSFHFSFLGGWTGERKIVDLFGQRDSASVFVFLSFLPIFSRNHFLSRFVLVLHYLPPIRYSCCLTFHRSITETLTKDAEGEPDQVPSQVNNTDVITLLITMMLVGEI